MFNQLLNKILKAHPLLGLERENQNLGHLTGLKAPSWIRQGPIYEVFVRSFSPEGTFKGVRDKIPYLKELGIRTIWLMPIYPIGQKDRKGSLGSPYAIKDYTAIDPQYGTKDELKKLITSAHRAGLRVILDLVANHMAKDNIWRDVYPDYFIKNDDGEFTRKISDWSDIIDLDYANKKVWTRMQNIIQSWVQDFEFDGFRCDVAGLVPEEFWINVYGELLKIKDDIFMLAEWESANLHLEAFHATYDWSTYFVLQDIYEGKISATESVAWVVEKEANYPGNALPMRFTENHDLERTRETFGEESFYPFVVFNFLVYGIPLIYCGQEFGLRKKPFLFGKDPIDWDLFDATIFDFYKNLIRLRHYYPAFSSRILKNIWNDKANQIVSFEKSYKDQKILAILNFSRKRLTVKLDLSDLYHNNQWFEDLFSGETFKKSGIEKLNIEPYGYFIIRPEEEWTKDETG
jgi:glycosidase